MDATELDWSMGSHAARLADWDTAYLVGRRVAGPGVRVEPADRARMREELSGAVARAEALVTDFSGLQLEGFRSRAWVMGRGDWIRANLSGLQRLLEPLAERLLKKRPDRPSFSRHALGAQAGALLGYVSRRVLGQFDVFLPPDDDGLIYFVGPNVVEVERRYALTPADFRQWIAIHEVTHRVQFSSAPWLRGYLGGMVDEYLSTVSLDARELIDQLRRAAEDASHGGLDLRQGLLALLSPEQRAVFEKTQGMMSLLEGHASFVMNEVAKDHVHDLERMRRALSHRRRAGKAEHALQKAIGFDQKVAQYDAGERFVRAVVDRVGQEGFNRVWAGSENLPSREEIGDPARWVERVSAG